MSEQPTVVEPTITDSINVVAAPESTIVKMARWINNHALSFGAGTAVGFIVGSRMTVIDDEEDDE